MVKAVLPTPPSPSTTSLYKVIFPAMMPTSLRARLGRREGDSKKWSRLSGGSVERVGQLTGAGPRRASRRVRQRGRSRDDGTQIWLEGKGEEKAAHWVAHARYGLRGGR